MSEWSQCLPIASFDVFAVYGVQLKVEGVTTKDSKAHDSKAQIAEAWKRWLEGKRSDSFMRPGWRPPYLGKSRLLCFPIGDPRKVLVRRPDNWSHPDDQIAEFDMTASCDFTVRDDATGGPGSMTIRLRALKRQGSMYSYAHVLAALLLAPRILSSKAESGKAQDLECDCDASRRWTAVDGADTHLSNGDCLESPLYRIFKDALRILQDMCPAGTDLDGLHETCEPWGVLGDRQMPYFVTSISVPHKTYRKAFLPCGCGVESLKENRKLTRLLGGILSRWLSPTNVRYVSTAYLEQCGLLHQGTLVNKYMNSLTFVTYNATSTLCVHPVLDDDGDESERLSAEEVHPQFATVGSVLRCVELSRLRWHQAKTLSEKLDDLISRITSEQDARALAGQLGDLAELRSQAATHFLDPLVHIWDATVGGALAQFLQAGVIDYLEKACAQKLDMVKQLIRDRLDVEQAEHIALVSESLQMERNGDSGTNE